MTKHSYKITCPLCQENKMPFSTSHSCLDCMAFDDLPSWRWKRERILKEQDEKCLLCGLDQIWNGSKLVFEVDHIDGNCSNNKRVNLRILCPNCHTQTPTFAGRNLSNPLRVRSKK